MAKNTGKVREFCQSGKVGTLIYWGTVMICGLFTLTVFHTETEKDGIKWLQSPMGICVDICLSVV